MPNITPPEKANKLFVVYNMVDQITVRANSSVEANMLASEFLGLENGALVSMPLDKFAAMAANKIKH